MADFHFELVSPERLVFSGEVQSVVVPGSEGQFTVLKDHAPLMSTLKPGVVDILESPSRTLRFFVRGGFADVAPTGLTILAERAVPLEEFDAAQIAADIEDAEDEVARAKTDEGRRLAAEKRDQLIEVKGTLKI
ncbi:F0F1 ATP synthase subunit epsilon [Methylocella sp.]|jgi:F-type H+-transporting ATPase subunit epsilon|uniref:F0F1 ATP synthase subunit epsilon n=1 Tax=Methylocella sp. TaxID=1978226 RepID=UPI003C2027CC